MMPGVHPRPVFDYTFTDRELNDILGFMEVHQGQPGSDEGMLATLSSPTHAARGASHPLRIPSFSGVKTEGATDMAGSLPDQLQFLPSLPRGSAPIAVAANNASLAQRQVVHLAPPTGLEGYMLVSSEATVVQQGVRGVGGGGGAAPGHRGPTVSHSSVEKQRRDRINSLIDELRDLVPAMVSGTSGAQGIAGGEGCEPKRPKHVVLSDTIALVKSLTQQIQTQDMLLGVQQKKTAELEERGNAARPPVSNDQISGGNGSNSMERVPNDPSHYSADGDSISLGSGDSGGRMFLPQCPPGVEIVPLGVVVEDQGDRKVTIKVCCEDRRGLLLDISNMIKSMPVEIKSAAITTTQDGKVYDVFEVVVEDTEEGRAMTAEVIQCQVEHAIGFGAAAVGEKRRKAND